jgi:hypothetical protein
LESDNEINHEKFLIDRLNVEHELIIPLFDAPTYLESLDKTSRYAQDLLLRHGIEKIDGKSVATNARYLEEIGHHIYIRTI